MELIKLQFRVILITILIIFVGCNLKNNKKRIIYEKLNKEYILYLRSFDKQLVNHFPKDENTPFLACYISKNNKPLELYTLETNCSEKQIKRLKKKSIEFYSDADTCLNLIGRFIDETGFYFINKDSINIDSLNYDCFKNKYPIPKINFGDDYFTETTKTNLTSDFIFYVFEAKKGMFFDREYYPNSDFMPKEWEHGYSRGVAISEKQMIIISWIVIW